MDAVDWPVDVMGIDLWMWWVVTYVVLEIGLWMLSEPTSGCNETWPSYVAGFKLWMRWELTCECYGNWPVDVMGTEPWMLWEPVDVMGTCGCYGNWVDVMGIDLWMLWELTYGRYGPTCGSDGNWTVEVLGTDLLMLWEQSVLTSTLGAEPEERKNQAKIKIHSSEL
jgi:hypothetical protein